MRANSTYGRWLLGALKVVLLAGTANSCLSAEMNKPAGDELSFNAPPDFSLERYVELMAKNPAKFFATKWGAMPYSETLTPVLDDPDLLPETAPIAEFLLEEAPLETVLRRLASDMQISLVVPQVQNGSVTADFRNMSPTNIFRSLARSKQLQVTKFYGAFSLEPLKAPAPLYRRYKLDFNYNDKADGGTSSSMGGGGGGTTQGSSGIGGGGGGGASGGVSSANASSLKPDYSAFMESVKTLAAVSFTSREAVQPVVVYDENEKVLTLMTSPAGHAAVQTYLETVNVPQSNIALEVFIAETSLNPVTDLGIDWSFTSGYKVSFDRAILGAGTLAGKVLSSTGITESTSGSTAGSTAGTTGTTGATAGGIPFGRVKLGDVGATIKMLQTDTKSRTYAHPRVLTVNNKPVTLESVVQIPYTQSTASITPTGGGATNSNSTAFMRVGLSIGFWPIIQGQNLLRMKTSVNISSLQGYSVDNQPIVSQRSYGGNFSIEDGEWLVIGGLGQSSFTSTKSGVPYLASMPILGSFFKTNSETKDTKHLLLFVRPVVLDRYNRGLALSTMNKAAMLTSFERGKTNYTLDGRHSNLKTVRDPFIRAQLDKTITDLEGRLEAQKQTLVILRDEQAKAEQTNAASITTTKESNMRLSTMLQTAATAEEKTQLAKELAQGQAALSEQQKTAQANSATFKAAALPVEKNINEVERELTEQRQALERILREERERLATEPNLGVTPSQGVNVSVGAQVNTDAKTPKVQGEQTAEPIIVRRVGAEPTKQQEVLKKN